MLPVSWSEDTQNILASLLLACTHCEVDPATVLYLSVEFVVTNTIVDAQIHGLTTSHCIVWLSSSTVSTVSLAVELTSQARNIFRTESKNKSGLWATLVEASPNNI